ncbi:MAG: M1 family metallopeptidase [Acidimicrobiia bacterium]|nr:M1 family metallopeptidase [Acidimicrobiia bacterium]
MSTYLVAFVVGPLEATEPVDVGGTPLRVVHPPGKGHLADVRARGRLVRPRLVRRLLRHPLRRRQARPRRHPRLRVRGHGEPGLCHLPRGPRARRPRHVDPGRAPERRRRGRPRARPHVVRRPRHHALVERHLAQRGLRHLHGDAGHRRLPPRVGALGQLRTVAERRVRRRRAALRPDPMEFEVVSPEDAEGMFDLLTYEKGAGVVRMLEQYLGAGIFREGIRDYLREHQYANTETGDLWEALEAASGEPVRRIMDSWIFQGGFPLIDVELHDDGGRVRLSQRRFHYLDDTADTTRWSVPVLLGQERDGDVEFERVLLEGESTDIDLYAPVDWVLVNTEGTGFYRVRYAPDLLAALTARAQTQLSAVERYLLVDDGWALVLAGERSAVDFLDFAAGWGDETDLSVWQRLVGALDSLDRLVDGPAREGLRSRIRDLVAPATERLGDEPSPGESDRDRQLRATLLEAAAVLGADEGARDRARRIQRAGDDVDPALRAAAIRVLAATEGGTHYEEFLERKRKATTPQDELRYLSALADVDEAGLLERTVAMTLTDEVRTQNAPYLLRRALTNRDHGGLAWEFVRANWEAVNDRFPSNSIVRMLEGVRALSRPEQAESVRRFFDDHDVPQGAKTLAQHLERLAVNVALRERESGPLEHALS